MKNLIKRIASRHMSESAVEINRTFRIYVEHQYKERTMTASFTPVTELPKAKQMA